jgi:hypothetical protein
MTVIAWDGKTLAADRMVVMGGSKRSATKIHKIGEDLFGTSGCMPIGVARIDWVRSGMNPDTFPRSSGDDEWGQMLRITPDGRVMLYNLNGIPMEFDKKPFAIGCGADFALAVMHLGCVAAHAVQVACDLNSECGMGIDTLEF